MKFLSGLIARTEQTIAQRQELSSSQAVYANSQHMTHTVRCTTVQEGLKIISWPAHWAQHFQPTSHLVKENPSPK